MPATSPPAKAPATSTAPIETHQRIAALPSFGAMVTRKSALEKQEHGLSLHIQVNQPALISPRLRLRRYASGEMNQRAGSPHIRWPLRRTGFSMSRIDCQPSRPHLIVLWTGLIAVVGIMVALFLPTLPSGVSEPAAPPSD